MSLSCEWMVLCERVLVDAQTQQVTLVDCLHQIKAATFPAQHHGFAVAASYRWTASEPPPAFPITHRLVRCSSSGTEEVLVEVPGTWRDRARHGRVHLVFGFLRLLRPETLEFRLEHRMGDGPWEFGAHAFLDVEAWSLSPAQRAELRAALEASGQAVPADLLD